MRAGMEGNANVEIDLIKFLEGVVRELYKDFDYAYPGGYLDEAKAHPALQRVKSKVKTLEAFIEAVKR
jgi:hypothetical protein